jgi:NAD(P)-dependent dehydrogenase (short-subunit alcohol dehydrogenase family)
LVTDIPYRIALIVGAGSGISASFARSLTAAGLRLGLAARNVEKLAALASETVSECATAAMDNGAVTELRPGDVFHIAPGHDSWVVGDEPYVSLHSLGANHYADHS